MATIKARGIYVLVLLLGFILGGLSGSYVSSSKDQQYFRNLHEYSAFVRAKERATLLQLLEKNSIEEARNVLYVVLAGDFDDYGRTEGSSSKACELLDIMGPAALADRPELAGDHKKSHQYLIKSVRAATANCKTTDK